MSKKRNRYSPEFKAKVALAALKNEQTISELSAHFGVHPTMINNWKRALLEGAADIFDQSIICLPLLIDFLHNHTTAFAG